MCGLDLNKSSIQYKKTYKGQLGKFEHWVFGDVKKKSLIFWKDICIHSWLHWLFVAAHRPSLAVVGAHLTVVAPLT